MILIDGDSNSNKTLILIKKYAELLNNGVESSKILVLTQNASKKRFFIEKTKELLKPQAYEKLNVYSFFGLSYNFIKDNWPTVENLIKNKNAKIEPNLCGLEVSQTIFKQCIDKIQFKGYNSKINLLHQLLRRYTLIVQNSLSEEEVETRVKILNESFSDDIKKALNLYKAKTIELRAFDYLRQTDIFSHLYKMVKNPYEYVFLDDGDEITQACFEYLNYIKPQIKEFFIAYDKKGSSRLGYLSAAAIDFEKFTGLDAQKISNPAFKNIAKNAEMIFNSIKSQTPVSIDNMVLKSFIRRDEMIDETIANINNFISNGVKPNEIALILPSADDWLKYKFRDINAPVFLLSGSEKLSRNDTCAFIIELLKFVNKDDYLFSPFILRGILNKILNLPLKNTLEITQTYKENYELDLSEYVDINSLRKLKLSEQLYAVCTKFIELTEANKSAVLKLNQLYKQIKDYEEVFHFTITSFDLLCQLENTIISENPLKEDEIPNDSIIVSTAQKIADNALKTKYQFWLDSSSGDWVKQDIGPLYNAWVFQKKWGKESFELNDNIELSLDKTARILRKIYLCQTDGVYIYSSAYDSLGTENFGGIDRFFIKQQQQTNPKFKITPRNDQARVLEYKKGTMAVSAVAGSGKTTIMLALIVKLLELGVKAQNIFVMTFMESAARNFKERIKTNFPNLSDLPHISTIHGLALRIIKENNNFAFLNLDGDFEIIDENKRAEIIGEILYNIGLDTKKTELYQRAISVFKNSSSGGKKSPLFTSIYTAYQNSLSSSNQIDYDDLLILALKLLKGNRSVRVYYQNLAQYIIEDEAQDSSAVQQELITILGGFHKNIIRCGDVNQAITATFSNSDVKGFKKFIQNNLNVEMDYSQRCSLGVMNFANRPVDYSKTLKIEAFSDIKMKAVKGKNFNNLNTVRVNIFDKQNDEKEFIIKNIKQIIKTEPHATIGLLTRSNRSVSDWAQYLSENSLKTITRSDSLINNAVFKIVLKVLNFLNNPLNNEIFLQTFQALYEEGFYKGDYEIFDYFKGLSEPFIAANAQYFSIWWDMRYFLQKNFTSASYASLCIGDFYFSNSHQKSNIAMVTSILEKISNTHKTYEDLLKRLNEIAPRANYTNTKFFGNAEEEDNTETLGSKVQIMTLHKSKGDEFDYVFIPELSEENLSLSLENIKLKENTKFIENLKNAPKGDMQLKEEIRDENFRLLYVGITRAKKYLYLSCSKECKFYKTIKNQTPNKIFESGLL